LSGIFAAISRKVSNNPAIRSTSFLCNVLNPTSSGRRLWQSESVPFLWRRNNPLGRFEKSLSRWTEAHSRGLASRPPNKPLDAVDRFIKSDLKSTDWAMRQRRRQVIESAFIACFDCANSAIWSCISGGISGKLITTILQVESKLGGDCGCQVTTELNHCGQRIRKRPGDTAGGGVLRPCQYKPHWVVGLKTSG